MPILSDVAGLLRFAVGLRAFVGRPISLEDAKAIIRRGMANREARFLEKVEHAVFGNPRSPYLQLFRYAGCELGDVRRLVADDGVDGALRRLVEAGVYVTFEEFKGLTQAVRGSHTFAFRASDFDNPLITTHFQSSSGGTRGRPTRTRIDLDHIAQSAPHWAVWFGAHGWLDRPLVFWRPTHAGQASGHLLCVKFGKRFEKWFGSVGMGVAKDRLAAALVHHLVRQAAGLSRPELVPIHEAARVGEYLVGMVRGGQRPCVSTSPSQAIAISLALRARGLSLDGVTFLLGAEPLTPARRTTIEDAGARAVPTYGFSEGGSVGSQCPNPVAADDIHVSSDAYAVIARTRDLGDGEAVDALLLTALRPACPKVLLNTEIGDQGVLETRRCDCLFDELGYHQHLHTIRSFSKLTGIGVTFVGADLHWLLEELLPQKFGGIATDYQLVEEQDAQGVPRYTLRVNPALGPLDEETLVTTFLEALGRRRNHYRFMATVWAQAEVLRVQRSLPLPTARGKILPFRTLGPA
jgi:hypothetical protein